MSVIPHYGRFLVQEVLSPWIKDGRFHPLPIPKGFKLEDEQEIIFPATLRCKITDLEEPFALFRPDENKIILSAGWLCQRWCSAFLLLNQCEPDTQLDRDPEVIDLEGNFIWPEYIPMPDSGGELVRKTNSVFAWLFQATITHELGHVILAPKADRLDTEYACDAFAAQWLLQTAADGKVSDKVVMLALTSWMCCICSEGLRGSSWSSISHPSPVRRTMRVLKQALPDNDEFGSAMWLLAATHVARLARLHNRPGADQIVDGNFTTIKDSFDILKQCW